MKIKKVDAKIISDSRKEKTIFVSIQTDAGNFSASSPTGKSTGKFEAKPYKKNLEGDIKSLKDFSEYFSEENIDCIEDLRRIEEVVDGGIGANSLFALESAVLKSLAKEQDKEVWQLINADANTLSPLKGVKGTRKFPRLVGNCVGGGKHSSSEKKPDFQEFLLIPNAKTVEESYKINNEIKNKIKLFLKIKDKDFAEKKNDEEAWISSLNEKEVLDVLREINLPLGIDVAASTFYGRGKYHYENPMLNRDGEEQMKYLSNLIKNFPIFYLEDPFEENDFDSFARLLKKFPDKLIVGDDLIVTSLKRLEKAIEKKSVNAIIVKPNQCGSLLEVKRVCELAKKNNIKIVFSHRSGETEENILADLAFGFQADFFKCGIDGKEREAKLKRLVEIEKSLIK